MVKAASILAENILRSPLKSEISCAMTFGLTYTLLRCSSCQKYLSLNSTAWAFIGSLVGFGASQFFYPNNYAFAASAFGATGALLCNIQVCGNPDLVAAHLGKGVLVGTLIYTLGKETLGMIRS